MVVKVRSHPPFALSLSKGQAELVEAFVSREKASTSSARTVMGQPFDKLRANGPLQTVKFRFGPTADTPTLVLPASRVARSAMDH